MDFDAYKAKWRQDVQEYIDFLRNPSFILPPAVEFRRETIEQNRSIKADKLDALEFNPFKLYIFFKHEANRWFITPPHKRPPTIPPRFKQIKLLAYRSKFIAIAETKGISAAIYWKLAKDGSDDEPE